MEAKVEQTLKILEKYACEGNPINYNDLYKQIGLSTENGADRKIGSKILGEISKITIEKNKTMLSSIVTLKRDYDPAEGFYDLAIELGLLKKTATEEEKIKFWGEQIKKVFNTYKK